MCRYGKLLLANMYVTVQQGKPDQNIVLTEIADITRAGHDAKLVHVMCDGIFFMVGIP